MRRLILILAIVLFAPRLAACVCVTPPLKAAFKEHDVVFVGRVVDVRDVAEQRVHTIEVIDALKNTRKGAKVVVHTDNFSSCAYGFELGSTAFVLAARVANGTLESNMCANAGHNNPQSTALAKRRACWWRWF